MSDPVAQPDHYRLGGIEVIDAICAWGFGEGFNRGNAIKYIARAGRKDPAKTVEDLRKAARYLEMEIRRLLGEPMTRDDAAAMRAPTFDVTLHEDRYAPQPFTVDASPEETADAVVNLGNPYVATICLNDEQATETIARLRQELNAESKRRAAAERELARAKP